MIRTDTSQYINREKESLMRVLMVDDEPDVTSLLSYAMRKEPYIIATASSGMEALEIFRTTPGGIDILITDIKMPGIDGLELTRILRNEAPDTQVIVITAHGDIDSAVEAMKLGAADFLQKPINNKSLRMSLRSAAEKRRLLQELESAQQALNDEKELLAVTMHSINEGVITTDTACRITMMNRMAEEFTGWTCDEARGLPLREVFRVTAHETEGEKNSSLALARIMQGKNSSEEHGTGLLVSRQGHDNPDISFSANLLRGSDRSIRGTVIVFRDITEKRREEQEARKHEKEKAIMRAQHQRSQKMEAIGMMAGGVAHDLNNILSGILSYPELMLLDLPEDSPLRRPLNIIQDAGQRAADVVADLLTVARGAAAIKESACLNTIIREYMATPEIRHPLASQSGIILDQNLSDDLLPIDCSPIHIRKCILNLTMNAIEATGRQGRITISTENRYIDKPLKGYDNVRQGEYTVLSVRDTGKGIAEQDLEHIFEPFYTKKVMGRSGTGLGLAVVWNTVQDHNGYIDVKTGPDGTCFDLYFPASRHEAALTAADSSQEIPEGRGESVLVIDDEPAQRDIACALLGRLGYRASAVSGGDEALEYLRKNSVDLLLLDMIMDPGMNGRQTYENIISIHPEQRAVIASGFSETEDVKRTQELGAGIFIRKPYTLARLGYAIRQELDRD